jgi:hypothetical protein
VDTNDLLQRVLDVVYRARSFGSRVLQDGTELIGHTPHVAPQAWFHVLFPGLTASQIESLEHALKRPLPREYRSFLTQMNGIRLFSGSLSIDGLRRSYERTGDAVWQPFNVVDVNTIERPAGAGPSDFVVGGYKADGSLLCVDADTDETWRRDRDRPAPLNHWPSLLHTLADEAERLAGHFDDAGKRIDPSVPTTPPADT